MLPFLVSGIYTLSRILSYSSLFSCNIKYHTGTHYFILVHIQQDWLILFTPAFIQEVVRTIEIINHYYTHSPGQKYQLLYLETKKQGHSTYSYEKVYKKLINATV